MDSSTSSSRSQEVNAVAASSSMLSVVIVFFIVVCLFEVNIFVFFIMGAKLRIHFVCCNSKLYN